MKRVTICIPTYNSEATLAETLNSVLKQSYKDIMVKIFDNASTDLTVQIARDFAMRDQRIQIFAHVENVGREGNFNRCIVAAEGDFTAIFHADGVYEPLMIESQVAFLEDHPECVAVATAASMIDAKGLKTGERFLPDFLLETKKAEFRFEDLLKSVLQFGNFITCPSVMARSNVYRDEIGRFRGEMFGTSSDLDVWLRFSKVGRFGILTSPLMRYRVSESSYTVRETKRRFTEHDLLKVLRHYVSDPTDGLRLTSRDTRYLKFHELKDCAARRLNIVLSMRRDISFPKFNGPWLETSLLAVESPYHLRLITISLAIFLLTFPLKMLRIFK
jgi:glycosyltransferase involved in cell wall biosynthesis